MLRKLKVISDIDFKVPLKEHFETSVAGDFSNGLTALADWRAFFGEHYRADVLFFDSDHRRLLFHCMLKALRLGRPRPKLIACDLVLPKPITAVDRVFAALRGALLRRADLYVLIQADFSDYADQYGLPKERMIHVPFKTNYLENALSMEVSDDGYYWSGGTTYRDWDTLIEAVRPLDAKFVITIPNEEELARRNENNHEKRRRRGIPPIVPSSRDLPSNVTIVRHGPDPQEWLSVLARARGVVLPIHSRSINPSGVSTYLTAMAFRKPVIISEGPSTKGLLENGRNALIVPPANPEALRAAIKTMDSDAALRAAIADAGYTLAIAAGNTERLHTDYLSAVVSLMEKP